MSGFEQPGTAPEGGRRKHAGMQGLSSINSITRTTGDDPNQEGS